MKIYTKTGDHGETSLYGGKRVPKSHIKVAVYGSVDELNSFLGIVISKLKDKRAEEFINQVQQDLFAVGSNLAGAPTSLNELSERVKQMEKVMDNLIKKMPELKNFILPEGCEASTNLYYARAITRRVERELVLLSQSVNLDNKILIYFNRLSDFLFVLARYLNYKAGVSEAIWKGKLK